jgi:pimeloyl-ACP methyl ester carboxylesterase
LLVALAAAALGVCVGGCISMPERNPALGLTREQAAADSEQMRHARKPLARPVVVLNGYRGVPTLANRVARRLTDLTSGNGSDILAVSYFFDTYFDRIAAEVVRRVEERWPSADPDQTIEVDVVGISMGGLVARWAALPVAERVRAGAAAPDSTSAGKRLRVRRLFTLGTPHRGATLAEAVAPDAAARDMVRGSPLLATLDARLNEGGYELVCYGQCRDGIVGCTRCAPDGQEPIWTSGTLLGSHLSIGDNRLFLADIARRLRGEEPLLHAGPPPPRD